MSVPSIGTETDSGRMAMARMNRRWLPVQVTVLVVAVPESGAKMPRAEFCQLTRLSEVSMRYTRVGSVVKVTVAWVFPPLKVVLAILK